MAPTATVIVRDGKAYVPTEVELQSGLTVLVEPVRTVALTPDTLLEALERALATQQAVVLDTPREERRNAPDPVLKAAGVKSWKELATGGASYSVYWHDDGITLYMSRLDFKGRFEADPAKTRTFAQGTPLRAIVDDILRDVASRPELRYKMPH